MTNTKLELHRDIGNGSSLHTYFHAFSWCETDDDVTDGWVNSCPGPIENNIIFYHCVMQSEQAAVQAILEEVGHRCDVVLVQSKMDADDAGTIYVTSPKPRHSPPDEHHKVFLLGRRSKAGIWLSDDLES